MSKYERLAKKIKSCSASEKQRVYSEVGAELGIDKRRRPRRIDEEQAMKLSAHVFATALRQHQTLSKTDTAKAIALLRSRVFDRKTVEVHYTVILVAKEALIRLSEHYKRKGDHIAANDMLLIAKTLLAYLYPHNND